MKIYLDDERPLPPWMEDEGGWVIARNPQEFHKLVARGLKEITAISFDHDLGAGQVSGYDLLCHIEHLVRVCGDPIPNLYIHTGNPSAAKKMYATVRNLERWEYDNR